MFGTTCILFMILFGSHATLVDMGILNSPYLSTYGFLGVVLVISLDMARDVVRASELSQELQQKEAEKHAAVNDERNRIASDLHDSVTQTLFSTAAIADALPDVWDRYPDEARRGLEDLRRLTKSALAEMRSLLLELHPTSLLEKDLGDLLEQLADAAVARTRIQVRTDVKGIQELPDQVKIALYRVAQEALNNAIKHAEASSVTLSLAWEAERLVLGVTDDGLGFDPESLKPGRLGIEIMRERIRSIGADLNIRTKPGMGTTVRVEWHDDRLGGLDG
jgi:signal transduction histidine kinase